MGRRLELLWRLRDPARCPAVVVAGARAVLQRLGPGAATVEPITVRRGDVVDADDLVRRLVEFGYRREELVEHRGELARRGEIIDVYPASGDVPVRIDLWGDDVDRLTSFGVNDQRSIADLDEVHIFPARELLPDEAVRERARGLVASEPWGREQWERLAEGAAVRRHGELAAVAGDGGHAADRRAAARRQGRADRAAPHPRPRRRPARRGGRPGGRAGVDLGPGRRPRVPAPARRARPPAGEHRSVLDGRLGARVPGDAGGGSVGVGPARRRRRRARHSAGDVAARRLPRRRRRRHRRLGGPAARGAPRPRARPAAGRSGGRRPRPARRSRRGRTVAPRRHRARRRVWR